MWKKHIASLAQECILWKLVKVTGCLRLTNCLAFLVEIYLSFRKYFFAVERHSGKIASLFKDFSKYSVLNCSPELNVVKLRKVF